MSKVQRLSRKGVHTKWYGNAQHPEKDDDIVCSIQKYIAGYNSEQSLTNSSEHKDGGYPEKLSKNAKIPLAKAQEIFDRYHNVLYSSITDMKDKTLEQAVTKGKVHLGLGCYMNTSEPESEIRTLFNALTI